MSTLIGFQLKNSIINFISPNHIMESDSSINGQCVFYGSEGTSINQITISVKDNVFLADNINVVRRKLKHVLSPV